MAKESTQEAKQLETITSLAALEEYSVAVQQMTLEDIPTEDSLLFHHKHMCFSVSFSERPVSKQKTTSLLQTHEKHGAFATPKVTTLPVLCLLAALTMVQIAQGRYCGRFMPMGLKLRV